MSSESFVFRVGFPLLIGDNPTGKPELDSCCSVHKLLNTMGESTAPNSSLLTTVSLWLTPENIRTLLLWNERS